MHTASEILRELHDRLPPDDAAVLRAEPGTAEVPATRITDPAWLAEQIRLRSLMWKSDDQRVLATLWWYSASTILVTPALAGLVVTGSALSPALDDTVLHHTPSSRLTGSHSTAVLGPDLDQLGAALAGSLAAVITALSAFTNGRERPLWAIATDAIANRLLWAGQAVGQVREATDLAEPIIAAAGLRLPRPRYVDVTAGPDYELGVGTGVGTATTRRFVHRASCCLLYRIPDEGMCTSCPGRAPAERAELLRFITARSAAYGD
jgi:ferric iron reductase protein FhuF